VEVVCKRVGVGDIVDKTVGEVVYKMVEVADKKAGVEVCNSWGQVAGNWGQAGDRKVCDRSACNNAPCVCGGGGGGSS